MSLSDEMKQKSLLKKQPFLCYFPSISEPLSHLFVIAKKIASLVTVSLRFQGAATIQLFLCLPPPNVSMKMQPDGGTFSLSVPLCSFGGASPSALFFPQTIHVGGLENKTEEWEDPCEHRLISFLYSC